MRQLKGLKWITTVLKTRQSLFILGGKAGHAKIIICGSEHEFCEINLESLMVYLILME